MSHYQNVNSILLVIRHKRAYKFVSIETFEEVVKFSLNIPEVNFVVATKFNQDLLEKIFGKHWQMR